MKNTRVPSVPLITCDPYFSVWSPADKLTDTDTCNWTGAKKEIRGVCEIDAKKFIFLGKPKKGEKALKQTDMKITATTTLCTFEAEGVKLLVSFMSPLLLSDLYLVSRPVSYIGYEVESTDDKAHKVSVELSFDEEHCYDGKAQKRVVGGVHDLEHTQTAWLGQFKQAPLCHSGDNVTIDWGYLYLSVPAGEGKASYVDAKRKSLVARIDFKKTKEAQESFMLASYDDIASINYFGSTRRGLWADEGMTITEAIEEAAQEYFTLKMRCQVFDEDLNERANDIAGESYAEICSLAYRQSIAAHKLILDDDGEVVFLSKECFSNGCIGTVDVSYPSIPLYLLFEPELVKGMMRPIFKFASMPVWSRDYAPHDVGRYPYATGQVYAFDEKVLAGREEGDVHPMYFNYPKGAKIYDDRGQMPVEECGNMLVMAAAVALAEGDVCFAEDNMEQLEQWVGYLIKYGADPGEQLCTDDFAGHLAHNANLALKAIMGIESYSLLLAMQGRYEEAASYHNKARSMAKDWVKTAKKKDHTALVLDSGKGWSLKYNMVWDKIFGSELFPEEVYENEIKWYLKKQNEFGVQLDSRADYTKSDWILWAATMAEDKESREEMIKPLINFLRNTPDRVPFSDWFDTKTAKQIGFQNRTVQGGLFMTMLRDKYN